MGNGCPSCAGYQVSVTNSLATRFPQVAAELDPDRNDGLTADQIVAGSNRKLWWRCTAGPDHTWLTTVSSRTRGGTGCPACSGNQVSVTNSLAARFPQVAAELDSDRNDGLTADQIVAGSNRKLWWRCTAGPDHQWQATANRRTSQGTGCPACAGYQLSVTNSLAARFPQIAAELDMDSNDGLTGDQIVAGSTRKVWWQCIKGDDHRWQTTIDNRTSGGHGCPCCAGRKPSTTNSLAALFPQIAAQLDRERNDGLTGERIVAGSNRKVWWQCPEAADHRWRTTVSNRTGLGHGCPCCAGLQASVTNSLAARFPVIAAQLDPDRNNGLTADQIVAGTHLRVWWRCPIAADHLWQASVVDRTRAGHGCPGCSGRQASVTNSLAARFPAIAAQLDPDRNNGLTADQIVAGSSSMKVWWRCPVADDHRWQATPGSRTGGGNGCPACAGQQASVTNSLASRFPELAAQLDPVLNGEITGHHLVPGSDRKVWWRCIVDVSHAWQATIANRINAGSGCPDCAVTGYKPNLPGFIYLLTRGDSTIQRKLGITNVPKRRLTTHTRNGWTVLEVSPAFDGAEARRVENGFFALLASRGVRQQRADIVDRFDGYTETWAYDHLPIDSLAEVYVLIGWQPKELDPHQIPLPTETNPES